MPEGVSLARDLVSRAAVSIDNAWLYARERATALALQRGLKQGLIVATQRLQGPTHPPTITHRRAMPVQLSFLNAQVRHHRQRLQIALVGLRAHPRKAVQAGHALGHRKPSHFTRPILLVPPAVDAELRRLIDHRFNPQHHTRLVVHLQHVPLDTMPHRRAGFAPMPVGLHGAGEWGSDGQKQATVGLGPAVRKREKNFPFLVIFPQSQKKTWPIDLRNQSQLNDVLATWSDQDAEGRRALAMLEEVSKEITSFTSEANHRFARPERTA